MAEHNPKLTKYEILSQIFELIDTIPKERLPELLNELASKNIKSILYKIVVDMNENEQLGLFSKLEELFLGKRLHARKECLLTTDYVFDDRAYRNFVKDISEGGVYVQTNQPIEVGNEIIQSFSLSSEQIPFKFSGEVVRADKGGIGVKFKNITQYQKDILKSLIKKLN